MAKRTEKACVMAMASYITARDSAEECGSEQEMEIVEEYWQQLKQEQAKHLLTVNYEERDWEIKRQKDIENNHRLWMSKVTRKRNLVTKEEIVEKTVSLATLVKAENGNEKEAKCRSSHENGKESKHQGEHKKGEEKKKNLIQESYG